MSAQIQRKLQIFISSTFSDLIRERQTAVAAILENGHIPAGMELFAAGDEEQMNVIKRWIDQSDIFLLLLGKRYGSIEPKTGKSYIQLEYEYAIGKKIPFFALVMNDAFVNAKVKNGEKLEDLIEQVNPANYSAFYKLVTSKMCSFADDHKDIKLRIWQSIRDLESRYKFNGWVAAHEVPDNSKIIEDISAMAKQVTVLQDEKSKLEKQITILESKVKQKTDYDGMTFEELVRLLNEHKVKLKFDNQKEVELPLLEALDILSSSLASGVSNAHGSDDEAIQLFYKVATPLAVYGIVQTDKVPSTVHWKRFVLSDLGKHFLYELRTKGLGIHTNSAQPGEVKKPKK